MHRLEGTWEGRLCTGYGDSDDVVTTCRTRAPRAPDEGPGFLFGGKLLEPGSREPVHLRSAFVPGTEAASPRPAPGIPVPFGGAVRGGQSAGWAASVCGATARASPPPGTAVRGLEPEPGHHFRGAARSPGQEDPGLAAPPHGVEHAEPAAAAAHGGQSHSVHHAQEPGHRSLPGPGRHPGPRLRAAIAPTKLRRRRGEMTRNPSGRPGGRGLEPSALRVRGFPGCQ